MLSPYLPCIGNFVIYMSCSGANIPLNLNYVCVFIDMLVHHITVPELMCLCMSYNIIVYCTSSWLCCPIYLICMLYPTTALLLHLHLYQYVCEYYIYIYCDMFVYFIRSTPRL